MNLNSKKKKLSSEEKRYHAIICPILLLFALLCAYPFYYLLICTISDSRAVDLGQVIFLPKGINWENYIKVFKVQGLFQSAGVSVVRVLVGTLGTLIVNAYTAYFFTKEKMWARKFWYRFVVVTMYFTAGLIPTYLNNKMLGLVNNFWIYVVPGLLTTYNMILIKTSIESLPADLEESAFLDGAGYLTRFFRIVLPLQKPILATVGLFVAVSHWNDFFMTKLYITKPGLYTLQFRLYELLNQVKAAAAQLQGQEVVIEQLNAITPTGVRMTLTAVVVIPVMMVYPFIQKFYVKGIMIGAVKG